MLGRVVNWLLAGPGLQLVRSATVSDLREEIDRLTAEVDRLTNHQVAMQELTSQAEQVTVTAQNGGWMDERLARVAAAGSMPVVDYDALLEDAMAVLAAVEFAEQPLERQIWMIVMISGCMVVTGHAQATAIACVAVRHLSRLLRQPTLTLPDACKLHDAIWAMWWSAASSLDDMRPIHAQVCLPFHDLLERRSLVRASRASDLPPSDGRVLRVAYLFHYAHPQRGNAVAPLVVSLARAHAAFPSRNVFVYAVQWVDGPWLEAAFQESGVITRTIAQEGDYGRLDALFAQVQDDQIDVLVSEITSSITTVLFARRAAPVQLWIDMGVPYWFQPEVDLVLEPGKRRRDGYPFTAAQAMEIHLFQDHDTLFREPPADALAQARTAVPADRMIIAVFSRLIKITPAYLAVVRAALIRHPHTHFLVGGGGDPRLVLDFVTMPELSGRVTFIHSSVDLAAYAQVIHLFLDTFPFIGGLACREIAAQGIPIVSLRSHEWDLLQERDRDPESIAEDIPALDKLLDRLLTDPEFYRARADATRLAAQAGTDVARGVQNIEAAIDTVRQRRDPTL